MAVGGYLKLFRKIDNWKWIDDIEVTYVFIRLLIKVNYKDKEWCGITIKRGQILTSRRTLAKSMNLTEQKLKTILKKLESTKEIEIEATHQYTVITIVNYEFYQSETEKSTHDQPTTNPQINPQTNYNSTQEVTHKESLESTDSKSIDELTIEKTTHKEKHKEGKKQPNDISKNNPNIRNNNILLNYTILNLLFNYLIYKGQKFENLQEKDREAIIAILKKLEIYTTSTEYIPQDKLLGLKIQYWVVTELYLSPYKIYINNLNKLDFMFRFFKTRQYVDYNSEEKLKHFVGYFIKSLREEMKANGNRKDTTINK